jgi:four helix bundle protein
MIYDLEERTTKFSKNLISFLVKLPITFFNKNIISQLLRSGTSIGANYQEANGSISKKDFKNKISICKKETKETKYWIELLAEIEITQKDQLRIFWKEAQEFILIFGKIMFNIDKDKDKDKNKS